MRVPLLLLILVLARGVAAAHTGSTSYAEISLDEQDVAITLQVSLADWLPVVDLDGDHDAMLTREEVRAQLPRLGSYVRSRVRVVADGRPCSGEAIDADAGTGFDATLTLLRMSYHCPAPIRTVTISSALFAREHPGHRTFAIVRDPTSSTTVRQHVFGPGGGALELALDWRATARGGASRELLRLGVRHLVTGVDHVLVLIGLLLAAPGIRELVRIVAAFTLGYTITLGLGALGVVAPDAGVVAVGTALTIAAVGVTNAFRTARGGRWQLAFACGLVHGFGFADVLGEMRIAPAARGVSLATFSAGIELGLMAIVCLVYPPTAWLRARPWGGQVVRGASAAMALAGLYLLVERALLSN